MKAAQLLPPFPTRCRPNTPPTYEASEPCAADGLGLCQAADDRGTGLWLGSNRISTTSSTIRRRPLRSVRFIVRPHTMARACLQAAVSRKCSPRSRPTCNQLQLMFPIRRRFDPAIDSSEIAVEIGARLREELDYPREARHAVLYRMLSDNHHPIGAEGLARPVHRPAADHGLVTGAAARA